MSSQSTISILYEIYSFLNLEYIRKYKKYVILHIRNSKKYVILHIIENIRNMSFYTL